MPPHADDAPAASHPDPSPVTEGPVRTTRRAYAQLLADGQAILPDVRIGRPGRSRQYWITISVLRLLRARYAVTLTGGDHVRPGAAIFVSNHLSGVDPLAVVMSGWWRITAFTKAELFAIRGSFFFRWMGQIPLRRGDEASTRWAMTASRHALAYGGVVAVYPEGTRSPDGRLHRLHKRVLVPLLQANPDVPVHAVVMGYSRRPFPLRTKVTVQLSEPIAVDARTQTPQELSDTIRDELQRLGGQEYVDEYARDVKKRQRPS